MAKPKSAMKSTTTVNIKPTETFSETKTNDTIVDEHIKDKNIHVDDNLRDNVNYARKSIESHSSNTDVHVTEIEKATWNNKETTQGAQSKANKVMNSLQRHENDRDVHLTKAEKEVLKDKYTKAEVRNLVKHSLSGLIFLESVSTKADLDKKYPNPDFNSCVYIRSTGTNVVYNGALWVDFNLILNPEATSETNGLMTTEDKIKLDSIESGANNYIHPDNIDTRHVSDYQIDKWDKKADNALASVFTDGLMSSADKVKLDFIDDEANYYEHPEYHEPSIIKQDRNNRFVTDEEKDEWNNKIGSDYVDNSINRALDITKSLINTKIANMFNTSEDQLEVIRSLAFELKNNTTVENFINLYNECIKNEEFNEHVLNDKIHMSREDIILLQNVKNRLEEIQNMIIPESLPANGGNADTIDGYGIEDLLNDRNDRCFFDCAITESSDIKNAFQIINDLKMHSVLFTPGIYEINKELVIKASNITLKGLRTGTKLVGASIKIIGNNNTIEDFSFENDGTAPNTTAIYVEGDNNIIKLNNIVNYTNGIIVEGSNNIIINNSLRGIKIEAIRLTSENNANYGNTVNDNDILYSSHGIVLMSSDKSLTKNHITKNTITNCTSGIILSNTVSDRTKTTMNIISQNIVVRGHGKSVDYLPGHKTIVSEFSCKNMISNNITSGKEIEAPNDVLSNNLV